MKFTLAILSIALAIYSAEASGEELPLGGPAGTCPSEDGEKPVYLLDVKNKYAFYECANGDAYLQYCTAGLVFNPRKDTCDYMCEECDPFGPVGTCPVKNPKLPVFLRDGAAGNVFYICENGIPRKLMCAEYLRFDPYSESCKPY